MLSGEKILITGVSGMVASPLAHYLAQENEVWGAARFADPEKRRPFDEAGITTRAVDIASGDFSELPTDFTYVLHFSWMRGGSAQLQDALRANVEGPGLLMQHCRKAKANLVISGPPVYTPSTDPLPLYMESDPIGSPAYAYAPTSPPSKAGVEAVARFCARAFDMPITIARFNTFNGTRSSMPAMVINSVLNDGPLMAPCDPNLHSPIHIDDIKWQLEALLDAASTPALIVNWGGDEHVSLQQWVDRANALSGKNATVEVKHVPGAPLGNATDATLRQSITGPSRTSFWDEFDKLYHELASSESTTDSSGLVIEPWTSARR